MSSDAERNAALYRQRMTQANGSMSMASPPAHQQAKFDPRLQRPPNMPPQSARPVPPGAPRSVKKITGSSRQISPRRDPVNRYHNGKGVENMTLKDEDGDGAGMLDGVNKLVVGIITILAISSVFVLPKQLKVFWAVILGLTFLIHLGFMLYKEWIYMGRKGGEDAKYAEWAAMLLYCLVMLYTAVMCGVLFFMAWSLYSIANSKTNLARLDKAALDDLEASKANDAEAGGDGGGSRHKSGKRRKYA